MKKLIESRDRNGNFKILLNKNEHIEWSIMEKLTKSVTDSRIVKRSWRSPDEKLRVLCKEAKNGHVRGVRACEALTVGGNKNLMWVDIDSYDTVTTTRWLKEQHLFPNGSYSLVESTTGKSHIYVITDRPLLERWQRGMRKMIRESLPNSLKQKLDRVYGPHSNRVIFLPNLSIMEATLPQTLVKTKEVVYKLPVNVIEDIAWKINRESR